MYYKDNGQIKLAKLGERFPEHPYAALVPLASDAEQAVLTEDIKANGLREPIVLWKGQIVDGRCRQKACLTARVQLAYVELKDDLDDQTVQSLVKSLNTRRNLTHTQKVMVAAKQSFEPGTSSHKQAKAWGVSEVLVKNARWLWQNVPEAAQALFDGKAVELSDGFKSSRVSSVYKEFKQRTEMSIKKPDEELGYKIDSLVKTMKGKEWLKSMLLLYPDCPTPLVYELIDLANFKFKEKDKELYEEDGLANT